MPCVSARQQRKRLFAVVVVVALGLARQCHVHDVVEVVVPLGVVAAGPRLGRQPRVVVVLVLQHQVHMTAVRGLAHDAGDLFQDMRAAAVHDGVHRVQPQAVDAELLHPVQRVVDEEVAHDAAAFAVEVDRCAPRALVRGREELRRIAVQVVARRAEVVVDHVHEHHQAQPVGGLDEVLELVGRAVGAVRSERQHAVVTPAEAPREVGQRHQLQGRHAQRRQFLQPLGRGFVGAFFGEGAHVHLVQHHLAPGPAGPARVPLELQRVHHGTGPVGAHGVLARRGVGHQQFAIDAPVIQRARRGFVDVAGPPAFAIGFGREEGRPAARADVHGQFRLPRGGRPQAEIDAARGAQLRAEGHAVLAVHRLRLPSFV
jgi:hypothetical protein